MILHSHSWAYTQCMLSHFSHVQLFVMLWTVTHQTPLSMGFAGQIYWSGLPFPIPGDLPYVEIEPESLMTLALASRQILYH